MDLLSELPADDQHLTRQPRPKDEKKGSTFSRSQDRKTARPQKRERQLFTQAPKLYPACATLKDRDRAKDTHTQRFTHAKKKREIATTETSRSTGSNEQRQASLGLENGWNRARAAEQLISPRVVLWSGYPPLRTANSGSSSPAEG